MSTASRAFCALVLLPSPVALGVELSLNLPQTFTPIRIALQGGTPASILVLGDSLSYRSGSYLPYFREHMQAEFGDAGAGYQGFSTWTGGAFNSQWVRGMINQDTPPHHSLDGLWSASTASPFPPVHTSAHYASWSPKVRLHYIIQPAGGTFEIRFPDLSTQLIATDAPSPAVAVFDHDYGVAPDTLRFQPQGDGWITILGQENHSGTPGVLIHRAANGGWGVGNFLQRDWTFDAQLALLEPDLIFIWLGQNDQAYNRPAYEAALSSLVDRLIGVLPSARIALIGTYDSGSANIPRLVLAMRNVAHDRGLGFINFYDAAGDYRHFVASGFLDDGLHFSHAGGAYLGTLLFDAFMTDGSNLRPGPCYANCTGSTGEPTLSIDDFICFIDLFAAGDPRANCDGSTTQPTLTVNDFICFIDAFAAGCR